MSSINFDNVYWFFIAIPLAVLLLVPFFIAVRKDNVNGHNVASAVLHLIMAVLIAFAAVGTSIVTTVTETDVYVLADVSYSANKNLDTLDGYIEQLGDALPHNSRMGVICFGKNRKVLTRLGEEFTSVRDAEGVDDSETDIVSALNYAGGLFRNDVIKRIVVITDGKQTYESDSNQLRRTVDALNKENIRVDAIFLDDNIKATSKEVQLSDVEYTATAYLERQEKVTVYIQSSYETAAVLTLYKNGEADPADSKTATLSAGVNTETFDLDTAESGSYDYEIRIEAEEDENTFNNSISFTQNVSDKVSVLLITENAADVSAVDALYGESADITSYCNRPRVPCSVEELVKYDEIIISNADVTHLENYTMFLSSLDTVVSLFGKSLLTLGDTNIQNYSDGELKKLDDMLPVRYGSSDQDPRLYTIVFDGSRSMFELGKLERAKLAAIHLVNLLNDTDEVAIVVFDGDVRLTLNTTSLTQRDAVIDAINGISVNQGTLIGLGLQRALDLLENADYSQKQVLLISDGLDFAGGGTTVDFEPEPIVLEMRSKGIFTSVVDIGRGSKDDFLEAEYNAKQLLMNIAAVGGQDGKTNYFYVPDSASLESVLVSDFSNDVNETIVNSYTNVYAKRRNDGVLKGIGESDLSYIAGFVNNKAKASATTVLEVDNIKVVGVGNSIAASVVKVPLYAYWNYGNGKVASFTSSISGGWIESWIQEGPYEQFFANVLSENIPSEKRDYPFTAVISRDNGYAEVQITPATVRPDAQVDIRCVMPSGEVSEGEMSFASSVYTYRFATEGVGKYRVEITYDYAGSVSYAQFVFDISFLPEYDSFAAFDSSGLHKMVGADGVVSEDGKLQIVNDDKDIGIYTLYLTVPLLIACVCLFVIDIIVRKLRWEDIRSLFKRTKK